MSFTDTIFSLVWDISDFFYHIGFLSGPIPLVGSQLREWFYTISNAFWYLLTPIAHFGDWVDDVASKVANILDINAIIAALAPQWQQLMTAYSWVYNAVTNITGVINTWWSTVQQEVEAWVLERVAVLYGAISYWSGKLTNLRAEWDSFVGKIPTIDEVISWWGNWPGNVTSVITTWWTGALLEVQGLINSAFLIREDFWAGWQDWRDKVAEFFTDPEDWLYKSVDRIIERFW